MVLVSSKTMLVKARKEGYAVGAFNVNNLETLQAVVRAAEECKSPVIIQTSEGAIAYAGLQTLSAMIRAVATQTKIPVALHLDHGKSISLAKDCLRVGYTSIMIDASHEKFMKNVKLTQEVVRLCKTRKVGVEAELGTIGGAEDTVSSRQILLTNPCAAAEFVKQTHCNFLAVAIGTSHGAQKFSGKAHLELELLREISQCVRIPLVLHGASAVPNWLVRTANKYGAELSNACGVPENDVRKAIRLGVAKINTDTDLRICFDAGIRKYLTQHPSDIDPRHVLGEARELMQQLVRHRLRTFGSEGTA